MRMRKGLVINYDIELPECCYKCFAYNPLEYKCNITQNSLVDDYDVNNERYNFFRKRHKNCPLEPITFEDV